MTRKAGKWMPARIHGNNTTGTPAREGQLSTLPSFPCGYCGARGWCGCNGRVEPKASDAPEA